MAVLHSGIFTSWDLTDEELIQGTILTLTQKQVMQNLLAIHAEEKLHIEFDPDNTLKFTQAEAYKRGQIDLLQYIIDASDAQVDIQKDLYQEEINAIPRLQSVVNNPMAAFNINDNPPATN